MRHAVIRVPCGRAPAAPPHRAEFADGEGLAVRRQPLLPENDVSAVLHANRERNQQHQRAKHHQRQRRQHNIRPTLDDFLPQCHAVRAHFQQRRIIQYHLIRTGQHDFLHARADQHRPFQRIARLHQRHPVFIRHIRRNEHCIVLRQKRGQFRRLPAANIIQLSEGALLRQLLPNFVRIRLGNQQQPRGFL